MERGWLFGLALAPAARQLMASAASRQAAKQRAVEAVAKLFNSVTGAKNKQQQGKKGGGGWAISIAQLKSSEVVPGLEGLDFEPPAEKILTEKTYEGRTCFAFRVGDWPRRPIIKLVESPIFDRLILVTILANCVTMAWQSPLDPPDTPKAAFIDVRTAA